MYVRVCVCAASGSSEDIGALSLALQIIDASQELQETVVHLKKLMPGASGKPADQLQPTTQGTPSSPLVVLCDDVATLTAVLHVMQAVYACWRLQIHFVQCIQGVVQSKAVPGNWATVHVNEALFLQGGSLGHFPTWANVETAHMSDPL